MGSGICRLGDICSGHADWPPRVNDEASTNVYVNGIGVHRDGDHWVTHCNSIPQCHDSVLQSGSSTVFVNNKEVGRIGDPVACGSVVVGGSTNVFAG